MTKTQPGTMERWGNWGTTKHPGVSMVLATALSIIFFILEINHVKSKTNPAQDVLNSADLLAAAAVTLTVWSFILMFFGNDWRFTFKIHAFIALAVTLTFAILSAKENAEDGTTEGHSITACVLAWCSVVCLSHVLWCCFFNMFVKRWVKKDFSWFATVISFFLTIISFILWLNSSGTVQPIMYNWVHGLEIAGTCFAAVASLSYFLGLIKDGDLLDLYTGIAFLSLTIFWIAAVAIIPDEDENSVFLTCIILTAFNTAILAYLASSVFKKFWGQSWSGRILIFTVILVIIQYTLAMTADQGNTGAIQPTPIVKVDNWWLGILSAGFCCAVAACFFSTLKAHLPTSLNFNAAALGLYIAYFVTECYNRASAANGLYDFNHRKGIAALALCGGVIVLLLISLILKSLAYKGDNNGDEKKAVKILCRSCCYVKVDDEANADETGVPEAGSATSSSD